MARSLSSLSSCSWGSAGWPGHSSLVACSAPVNFDRDSPGWPGGFPLLLISFVVAPDGQVACRDRVGWADHFPSFVSFTNANAPDGQVARLGYLLFLVVPPRLSSILCLTVSRAC